MLLVIICANLKFSVPKQISFSIPPLNPALPLQKVPMIPSRFRPPPKHANSCTSLSYLCADRSISQGQKATFHNPQYHVAPEVLEVSKLLMDHPDFGRQLFTSKLKRKPCNCSQDVPPNGSLGAKHAHSDVSASEGKKSTARTGSHKKIVFTDDTEWEPVVSKSQGSDKGTEYLELLQHAQEGTNIERKTASNTCP
ncbi:hypothetical protein BDR05DRAFT_1006071 [Suillus weaverae]|nr:hypothetical protein BDR05DRAFT_1006071 [Suillus weaverae]